MGQLNAVDVCVTFMCFGANYGHLTSTTTSDITNDVVRHDGLVVIVESRAMLQIHMQQFIASFPGLLFSQFLLAFLIIDSFIVRDCL